MVEEDIAAPIVADADAQSGVQVDSAKKPKPPRRQKLPVERATKAVGAKLPTSRARKYGEQEKIEKLEAIEKDMSEGRATLKDAVKTAGISEQTYYNWKQTAKPAAKVGQQPLPTGDELADLAALEEENKRLRTLLAEKLRAENTELRRRLGLD